jgi:hypothetical protein
MNRRRMVAPILYTRSLTPPLACEGVTLLVQPSVVRYYKEYFATGASE